ncbi:MAG: primosome assembly protein PriA, partial [Aeromicrobium sp.]
LAERELAERAEAHLPPVARVAVVEAPADVVAELASRSWPGATEVLGPVPVPTRPGEPELDRLVLRAPRRDGPALAAALKDAQSARSAAKLPSLRVRIDPHAF